MSVTKGTGKPPTYYEAPKVGSGYFSFRLGKLPEPGPTLGVFFMNIDYNNYIGGSAWKQKRKEFLSSALYDGLCFCCRTKNKHLQIHHVNYDNFKNENLIDLCAVCLPCHLKIHKLNRVGSISLDKCHLVLWKYFKYKDKNNFAKLKSMPPSDFVKLTIEIKSIHAIKKILSTKEGDHVCNSNGINVLILNNGRRLPESRKNRRKNKNQIIDIAVTCSKCGREKELYNSLSDFYKKNYS